MEVGKCDWVTHVQFLSALKQLRLLSLRGCRKLHDISPLVACEALQVSDLRDVGYSLDGDGINCLQRCPCLVRVILGQDEFDSDPADHIVAPLLARVVLAPTLGYGKLEDAVTMKDSYADLKDSSSWGFENMLCY